MEYVYAPYTRPRGALSTYPGIAFLQVQGAPRMVAARHSYPLKKPFYGCVLHRDLDSTDAENSSGPPNRLVGDLDREVALGNRVVLLDQDTLDLSNTGDDTTDSI